MVMQWLTFMVTHTHAKTKAHAKSSILRHGMLTSFPLNPNAIWRLQDCIFFELSSGVNIVGALVVLRRGST